MWDPDRGTRVPLPDALSDGLVTKVWFTADPTHVLVESVTNAEPRSYRLAGRSLVDGSVRQVLAEGDLDATPHVEVTWDGAAVTTCIPSSTPATQPDTVVVRATDTAAELTRIPLAESCWSSGATTDGHHLAEPGGSSDITGYRPDRIVDLASGAAVDVAVPPGSTSALGDPTLTAVDTGDGPPAVLIARGTTLLPAHDTGSATRRARRRALGDGHGRRPSRRRRGAGGDRGA
jgi:hypothetical protein